MLLSGVQHHCPCRLSHNLGTTQQQFEHRRSSHILIFAGAAAQRGWTRGGTASGSGGSGGARTSAGLRPTRTPAGSTSSSRTRTRASSTRRSVPRAHRGSMSSCCWYASFWHGGEACVSGSLWDIPSSMYGSLGKQSPRAVSTLRPILCVPLEAVRTVMLMSKMFNGRR